MKKAIDYAKAGCDTLMRKFSPELLPPAKRFHYHQGVFLSGMERTYLLCKDEKYNEYLTEWFEQFIKDPTLIHTETVDQFDDLQPAILLFRLFSETNRDEYKQILDDLAKKVEWWPKNAKGAFWHKYENKNEMWLDTMYMVGPFMAMYAEKFPGNDYFYEGCYQVMRIMRDYMRDEKTGLFYHAWDDSKHCEWANPDTGRSSQFWGRAIGWYAVAILDILDYLPKDHPRREAFIQSEIDLLNTLIRYQNQEDGRWYQVVNRGDDKKNWLENSCSCLYVYSLAKAVRLDLIDKAYLYHARKGYEGVVNTLQFEGEDLILPQVCIGTAVGDYDFYLNRPVISNDLHGMGAFVLMCTEMSRHEEAE